MHVGSENSIFMDLALSFGSLKDCIAFADPDWRISFANPSMLALLGRTPEECLARPVRDLFSGLNGYLLDAEGTLTSEEARVPERAAHTCLVAGANTPVEILCAPIKGTDSELNGYLIIARNISERVGLQAEVNSLVARLEDSLEALSEGFALYDQEDRLLACNKNYRQIYSASAESMVPGTTFEDILRFGLDNGQYDTGGQSKKEWLAERVSWHQRADGQVLEQELGDGRWLRVSEKRTRSGGIAGIRADITELKHAKAKAEQAYNDLSVLADSVSALIVEVNREGLCLFANRVATEWLNAPSDTLIGTRLDLHVPTFSERSYLRHISKAFAGEKNSAEIRVKTPDGRTRDCLVEFNPKSDAHGNILSIVMLANDITARRDTERTLAKLYEITSTRALDHSEKIQEILELGCKYFLLPMGQIGEIAGNRYTVRNSFGADNRLTPGLSLPLDATHCARSLKTDVPVAIIHTPNNSNSAHPLRQFQDVETYIGMKLIVDGEIYGTLSFSSPNPRTAAFSTADYQILQQFADWIGNEIARQNDHQALLDAQLEMERAASIDDLTQIWNRRAFFNRAQEECERYRRSGNPCSVVMLDIDHFKRINDRFGHRTGDKVLRKFAKIVGGELRSSDTFGRVGGEEFCMLLFNTDSANAIPTCERLLEKIREQCIVDGMNQPITCSIGVDEIRREDKGVSTAMQRADNALYTAKESGRNCIIRYADNIHQARTA